VQAARAQNNCRNAELNLYALIEAIEHNWPRPSFPASAFIVKILTSDVTHNKSTHTDNFIDDIADVDSNDSESTQSDDTDVIS
jgi:hypothetical protein